MFVWGKVIGGAAGLLVGGPRSNGQASESEAVVRVTMG
jgi:hypothetical protein